MKTLMKTQFPYRHPIPKYTTTLQFPYPLKPIFTKETLNLFFHFPSKYFLYIHKSLLQETSLSLTKICLNLYKKHPGQIHISHGFLSILISSSPRKKEKKITVPKCLSHEIQGGELPHLCRQLTHTNLTLFKPPASRQKDQNPYSPCQN